MVHICHVFVIFSVIVGNFCNNTTGKYNSMDIKSFRSKHNRLITFNTQDTGDISMELAFNVPFITIPVKKSIDMAQGAIANVNIGAIILGGAIIFGFAVIIPGILLLLTKKSHNSTQRSDDLQWWDHLKVMDQVLSENNIDTTSCVQRMICSTVKKSAHNVMMGQSSSSDKIIEGLATSEWLQYFFKGTIVDSALQNGLSNMDCSSEYHQCLINDRSIKIWTNKFMRIIGSK